MEAGSGGGRVLTASLTSDTDRELVQATGTAPSRCLADASEEKSLELVRNVRSAFFVSTVAPIYNKEIHRTFTASGQLTVCTTQPLYVQTVPEHKHLLLLQKLVRINDR